VSTSSDLSANCLSQPLYWHERITGEWKYAGVITVSCVAVLGWTGVSVFKGDHSTNPEPVNAVVQHPITFQVPILSHGSGPCRTAGDQEYCSTQAHDEWTPDDSARK